MDTTRRSLHDFRADKGLELDAVAKQVGVSPTVLQEWENGKAFPTTAQAQQLASIYGVPTDQLGISSAKQST